MPLEETKSVAPTVWSVGDWLAVRPGPLPLVLNGTRSSPAEPLTPEASRATSSTPSRCPRAWLSAERPDEVSVK